METAGMDRDVNMWSHQLPHIPLQNCVCTLIYDLHLQLHYVVLSTVLDSQ